MRKLTPEEREKLQAMLDKESVGQAEKDLKLLKHNMVIQRKLPRLPASNSEAPPVQRRTSKRQELIDEGQKQKKQTGSGPGLRKMKLTEKEKKELEAKIRGTS